jgi:glucose-6-phosphate-specific signal transduction histidine kinase
LGDANSNIEAMVEFTLDISDRKKTGVETLKNDSFLEINMYRLIQEGLNNIRKHA